MTRSLCCSTVTHFLHGTSKGTHLAYIWHISYICTMLWCCTTPQSQVPCPCWVVPRICNVNVFPQTSSLCWWSTPGGYHPCFTIVCTCGLDTQIWSTSRSLLNEADEFCIQHWTNISINRCITHLHFHSILYHPLYISHLTINQNLLPLMSSELLYQVLLNRWYIQYRTSLYYEIGVCWWPMLHLIWRSNVEPKCGNNTFLVSLHSSVCQLYFT